MGQIADIFKITEVHKRDINSTGEIPTFVLDRKIVAEAYALDQATRLGHPNAILPTS